MKELTIRMVVAKEQWNIRKALYPRPQDIAFIPFAVTRPIRGVKSDQVMLLARTPFTRDAAGRGVRGDGHPFASADTAVPGNR